MINIRGNEIDEEKILGVAIKSDSDNDDSSTIYYILEVLTRESNGTEKSVDIMFGNKAGVETAYNTVKMHINKLGE